MIGQINNKKALMLIWGGMIFVLSWFGYAVYSERDASWQDVLTQEYATLSKINQDKSQLLTDYFYRQIAVAESLAQSEPFVKAFASLRRLSPQATQSDDFLRLEKEMESHFVFLLEGVYDLLLVDPTGEIFFTIKKEGDLGKQVFASGLKQTALSKVLQQRPTTTRIVDFEPYSASQEAAAFIVVPVRGKSSEVKGYAVFQIPINQVDALLQFGEEMGQTGESYLVNAQGRLLTSSRFYNRTSTMTIEANTPAVKQALAGQRGHALIEDYRQVKVLSAFQSFALAELPDFQWALVSEKDLDEVLGQFYLTHEKALYPQLVQQLTQMQSEVFESFRMVEADVKVDMSEYQRLNLMDERGIYTLGAATCSVLSVVMPEQFVYMAHIPPTDQVYQGQSASTSNLLQQMLYKIQFFDLTPSQMASLKFYLTASHTDSLQGTIQQLLLKGVRPSQIELSIRPEARSVNVRLDAQGRQQLEWVMPEGQENPAGGTYNFGQLLQAILSP